LRLLIQSVVVVVVASQQMTCFLS